MVTTDSEKMIWKHSYHTCFRFQISGRSEDAGSIENDSRELKKLYRFFKPPD